jgi:hypothetical protein
MIQQEPNNTLSEEISGIHVNNYIPGHLDNTKETIGGTTDASGTIVQKFPNTTKNQQQRGINYGVQTQARLKNAMARPNQ